MKSKNSPNYVENIGSSSYSIINMASPFKDVPVAFNWLNTEYPTMHTHEHWEILVIMSGSILHEINGYKQTLNRGDAFLIRPQDRHCLNKNVNSSDPYQHLNFIIDNEFAHELLNIYDDYDELLNEKGYIHFSIDDSDVEDLYERALLAQNLSKSEYVEYTKLIISYLLLKFFEQKKLFNSEYPMWLNSFIVYISSPKNFGQPVQELAKNTSYSYSRLARIFKNYTGETIVDYINGKRMMYAKRLLRSTDLTTLQISNQIGYTSLSSFNHLFKKTFGITPSAYRKEHQ